MHNGYLQSEGQKMSKSTGNFYTVKEILGEGEREKMWRGESIRLMMLGTHYRRSLDFTKKGLEDAKRKLDRWYRVLGDFKPEVVSPNEEVMEALCDDLNTPRALVIMDALCSQISAGREEASEARGSLYAGARAVGLLQHGNEAWFQGVMSTDAYEEGDGIESLIAQRLAARQERNFDAADSIRNTLLDRGVVLEDKPDGTTIWRRTT